MRRRPAADRDRPGKLLRRPVSEHSAVCGGAAWAAGRLPEKLGLARSVSVTPLAECERLTASDWRTTASRCPLRGAVQKQHATLVEIAKKVHAMGAAA
jgi:hypothetical protein